MENKASTRVAFCGLFAAFMLVVMLLGTAIPMTTFLAPALAGNLWTMEERTYVTTIGTHWFYR